MKNNANQKGSRDPNVDSKQNRSTEKRMDLLVGELKALMTCPHEFYLFQRLLSRTMVMMKKEPSLRKLMAAAKTYHQRVTQQKKSLLNQINGLRKELKLDEVLPSLVCCVRVWERIDGKRLLDKGCEKKSYKPVVPVECSDRWLREAREWANAQKIKVFSKRGEKILNLKGTLSRWECAEPTWYPIGKDPKITLARLMSVCERVAVLPKDEMLFSLVPRMREPAEIDLLEEVVKDLRCELGQIITNLIAELPIIKSWGKNSVEALDWKGIVDRGLIQLQLTDQQNGVITSFAEMARQIHPEVKKFGISVSTVETYLRKTRFRTKQESKQAQLRKKSKTRGT